MFADRTKAVLSRMFGRLRECLRNLADPHRPVGSAVRSGLRETLLGAVALIPPSKARSPLAFKGQHCSGHAIASAKHSNSCVKDRTLSVIVVIPSERVLSLWE
jgi:hypothetical protein